MNRHGSIKLPVLIAAGWVVWFTLGVIVGSIATAR